MTDIRSRHIGRWKIISLLVASLLAIVLGFWIWIWTVANRKWSNMEHHVQELLESSKARDPFRPILRGEPIPGNAWDDYEVALAEAMKELLKVKGSYSLLHNFVDRKPDTNRRKVEVLLPSFSHVIDLARHGVLHMYSKSPRSVENDPPDLTSPQTIIFLFIIRARTLIENGHCREAAEILLDGCQFARDFGFNGLYITEAIGKSLYESALMELRDLILSKALLGEDLLQVEHELEVLDGSFMSYGPATLNESVHLGANILGGRFAQNEWVSNSKDLWSMRLRFCFSSRLMEADAYEQICGWHDRWASAEVGPWLERKALWGQIAREVASPKHEFAQANMIPLLTLAGTLAKCRAHLRLLRVATHFLATHKVLADIGDPFGAKIHSQSKEGKLRLWSVGVDGFDHNGSGQWEPVEGMDILIEIGQ